MGGTAAPNFALSSRVLDAQCPARALLQALLSSALFFFFKRWGKKKRFLKTSRSRCNNRQNKEVFNPLCHRNFSRARMVLRDFQHRDEKKLGDGG